MQAPRRPANYSLLLILALTAGCAAPHLFAQSVPVSPTSPAEAQPVPANVPVPAQNTPAPSQPRSPAATSETTTSYGPTQSGPLAIVPLDSKDPSSAAMVTGALQVANGRAMIATNGAITSGTNTTEVTLPRRGVLRVCAATTVKLAADASVP